MKKIFFLIFTILLSIQLFGQTYNIQTLNGTTQTTCAGTFVDPGGAAGNYANSQDYTITFHTATAGQQVRLSFTAWDLENNFDYLYVYDGPSIASPSLGNINGHRVVGTVTESDILVTSSNGYLTFKFHSDSSTPDKGWQATITCVTAGSCTTPTVQDCLGAIPICGNSYTTTNSYVGPGNCSNEISGVSSCLRNGEKNDVWYVFNVQNSGNLTFTLTPNNTVDDYDWSVFNLTNNTCADLLYNQSLEVSCNYAITTGTPTGCLTGNTGTHQWAGGTQYNAPIPVTVGQTYVINVSNYTTSQSGYNINFSSASGVIVDVTPPVLQTITSSPACGQNQITFYFSERVICSTVGASDFTVTGPGGPYSITNVVCNSGATYSESFTITLNQNLTTGGTFSLNLVGQVSDACNNLISANSLTFSVSGVVGSAVANSGVTCFGGSNGSATASASGGTAPYFYIWDNGATTATVNNLNAGTHSVTITDNLHVCTDIRTVSISSPPALAAGSISSSQTICSGGDPSIMNSSANASGGVGTINYQWEYTTVAGCASGWANYAGATSATLDLPVGSITTTTCFRRKATDNCTSVYSNSLTITVDQITVGGSVNSNATVCSGANSGTLTLSGQTGSVIRWEYSISPFVVWTPISNTTTSQTYTNLTQTTQYRAVVQNGVCSSQNSSFATITVNVAPAITLSPVAQIIGVGGMATYTITATGTGLTYQWQESTNGGTVWNPISNGGTNPNYAGATTNNLTISSATAGMTGYLYRCVVTGTCSPAATSSSGLLTVNNSPAITSHPTNLSLCAGVSASFTTTATGTITGYQWQESINGGSTWNNVSNGGIYSGALTATLTINPVGAAMNNYQYKCIVAGMTPAPSATTNVAILTVYPAVPGTPSVPSGSQNLCLNSANSTYTSTASNAATYNWTITPGTAGVISGTGTTATIDWNNAYSGNVQINVNGINSCGSGPISTLNITISSGLPAIATTPTGTAFLCQGSSSNNYTTIGAAGAVTYNWTVTPAAAGTISGTGLTGSMTWNAGFTGTATISVNGVNACGSGPVSSLNIIVSGAIPSITTVPSGPISLCLNSVNSTYSTTSTNANSYTWSILPAGAGVISGTTTTASVDWNNAFTGSATISVFATNGCGNGASNTLSVNIDQPTGIPSIPSGPTSVCAGTGLNAAYSTSATNANSYIWTINPAAAGTISGSGSSINVLWNAGYVGTATVSVKAANNCDTTLIASALSVIFDPVTLGGIVNLDNTVCSGSNSGTLNLTGNTGNVTSWEYAVSPFTTWTTISNTTTSQTYLNLTQTTEYRANVTSGSCSAQNSISATITVNTAPSITTPPVDQIIGVGGSVSYSITANGAGLTYQWEEYNGSTWQVISDGGAAPNYSGATTATLTINSVILSMNAYLYRCVVTGTCSPTATSGTALLTVNNSPAIATAPNDSSICSNSSVSFSISATGTITGYQWEESANGGASWSNVVNGGIYSGANTPILTINPVPASMDGFEYRCVVGGMLPAPNTVSSVGVLTVFPSVPGLATIPVGPVMLCVNSANSNYFATAANATAAVWSLNPPTAGIITGNGATATVDWNNTFVGTVQVSMNGINNCGAGPSNSVDVIISAGVPDTTTIPTGNLTMCINSSNSLYTTTGATDAITYNWILSPSTAGTITGNGLSAIVDWDNAYTGAAIITVNGNNGCGSGPATNINVIISPTSPGMASPPNGPTSLCVNNSNTTYTSSATNATSYVWSISPASAGTITTNDSTATVDWNNTYSGIATIIVYAVNGCGNGTLNSVNIAIDQPAATPTIPNGPAIICSSAGTVANYSSSASNVTGYIWTITPPTAGTIAGSGSTVSIQWTVGFTGTAIVGVSAINNCDTSVVSELNVVSSATLIASATSNGPVCSGNSLNLNANPVGAQSYSWTGPNSFSSAINNPIITNVTTAASGIYTIVVANGSGCSDTATINVVINETPIISVGPDATICDGNSAELSVTGGGTYLWTPANSITDSTSATPVASPNSTTTYIVVVTSANGCTSTENTVITVNPTPIITLTSTSLSNQTYAGEIITFTANPAGYPIYQFYVDNVMVQTGNVNIYESNSLNNGQVVYVIASENGCLSIYDSIKVEIKPFPNAFTPDNDGVNDIFLKGIEIIISNRWGQELYKGIEGWDGTFNGQLVSSGTYYYIATYYDLNENKTTIKGAVTVSKKK
ncbi:MAG: gliding motility-associated C-terminal domain-containing protein [Bacteroidetes bacterium]|nr:gliding motility-associated C-terminal domain-containing protein [Bacteroidota bacterium]